MAPNHVSCVINLAHSVFIVCVLNYQCTNGLLSNPTPSCKLGCMWGIQWVTTSSRYKKMLILRINVVQILCIFKSRCNSLCKHIHMKTVSH